MALYALYIFMKAALENLTRTNHQLCYHLNQRWNLTDYV